MHATEYNIFCTLVFLRYLCKLKGVADSIGKLYYLVTLIMVCKDKKILAKLFFISNILSLLVMALFPPYC